VAHITVPLAPAYCMSKRGIVAYSDALRLELGHEITVTTVYPGYVRTPIHRASQELGFALEGMVPAEPLNAVAARVARAAVGPPVRDLATSRAGTASYALARRAPRRVLDAIVLWTLRRQARTGSLDASPWPGTWRARCGHAADPRRSGPRPCPHLQGLDDGTPRRPEARGHGDREPQTAALPGRESQQARRAISEAGPSQVSVSCGVVERLGLVGQPVPAFTGVHGVTTADPVASTTASPSGRGPTRTRRWETGAM